MPPSSSSASLYHEPPPTPSSMEPPSPQSPATPAGSSSGGGASNVSVKCPYDDCDMEFSARYSFWQHMCDKHQKEELLRQIPHTPTQPYQCPAPGCSYNTKDSRQALVRHYGMTHKVVQTLLGQKFPEFAATDKFATPSKAQSAMSVGGGGGMIARPRAKTPVRMVGASPGSSFAPYQQHQPSYIQHQGQPHIQQVVHHHHQQQEQDQLHLQQQQYSAQYHHQPHQAILSYPSHHQQQQQQHHQAR